VWESAPYEGGTLLVLLALADWANDDGYCFPGVAAIAEKARLGERQVHNILRQFRTDGVIEVEHPGGGRGVKNRYRLTLNWNAVKCSAVKPDSVKSTTETLQSSSQNPAICDVAIRKNRHEPSIEPSTENNGASRSSTKRGTRIPDNFAVTDEHREFARRNGLPDPDQHIDQFIDYWRAESGSKGKKLDWDATFRNWLRRENQFNRGRNGNGNGKLNRAQQIQADNLRARQEVLRKLDRGPTHGTGGSVWGANDPTEA
jgi:hypothetical protein